MNFNYNHIEILNNFHVMTNVCPSISQIIYVIRGSITVPSMISSLAGLDSAKQVNLLLILRNKAAESKPVSNWFLSALIL